MTPSPAALDIERLLAESATMSDSYAASTRRSYEFDWRTYRAWCATRELDPLPAAAETVLAYLTDLLHTHKIVTVARHASAIRFHHSVAGLDLDLGNRVRRLLQGAQRIKAERPIQKQALTTTDLAHMCHNIKGYPACIVRNRSILTLGFASALRRSSLVGLNLEDIEFVREGLVISVRKEKQDQKARGRRAGVAFGEHLDTCPVEGLQAWIRVRGQEPGPLYLPVLVGIVGARRLHPGVVARIVKEAGRRAGLEPSMLAGNSLRSGMISQALLHGVDSMVLAQHTGHRSMSSLRRYFRRTSLWEGNPSARIGL